MWLAVVFGGSGCAGIGPCGPHETNGGATIMVATSIESLFYLASAEPYLTLACAAFSCRENLMHLLPRHARVQPIR